MPKEQPSLADLLQEDPVDREALRKALDESRASADIPAGIDGELHNQHLKKDAPWGLAVYRTCYDDEAAWQKMRSHLESQAPRSFASLDERRRESVLARHRLVFMDDEERFRDASLASVRDDFEQWARDELLGNWAEQPVTEARRSELFGASGADGDGGIDMSCGTRYNVCAVVDDVCLESLDRPGGPGPLMLLLRKCYDPAPGVDGDQVHPDFDEGWMWDKDEGPNGWIYVGVDDYVHLYDGLCDWDTWQEDFMFMSPSAWYSQMSLERSPAFWREEREEKKADKHAGPDA